MASGDSPRNAVIAAMGAMARRHFIYLYAEYWV